MRVDDPDQTVLLRAMKRLGPAARRLPILLVHTALHTVDESDLPRMQRHNAQSVADALHRQLPEVAVDFRDPTGGSDAVDVGLPALCNALIELVPALEEVLSRERNGDEEQRLFDRQRKHVLGYAGAAAAVDAVPAIGAFAVPGLQGKMLHSLARRYGLDWNKRSTRDFLAALGSSMIYRYALGFAGRQLAKFIPGVGQTIGAATAASVSFASTYALGRAAALYMYRRRISEPVSRRELKQAFTRAFQQKRHGPADQEGEPAATVHSR
jgi:uncharacterized protein (DUF697 family)